MVRFQISKTIIDSVLKVRFEKRKKKKEYVATIRLSEYIKWNCVYRLC